MKVLMIILLLLGGLLLLRVGCLVQYDKSGFCIRIKLGPFYLRLPALSGGKKPEEKKRRKKKSAAVPSEKETQTEGKLSGGSLKKLLSLAKPLLRLFGSLIRKLHIDWMKVDLTYGGLEDPAGAALLYGETAAGAGILEPLLHQVFASVRHHEFCVQVDFTAAETVIALKMGFSLRIGQLLWFAIRAMVLVLPVLLDMMKGNKPAKEESENGTASH